MDFLGIGVPELFFILIIALIVIGPRDLASTARTAGRFLNQIYRSDTWRTVTRASRTLRDLPNQLAREAALEELDETRRLMRETEEAIHEPSSDIPEELKAWTEPPESHPEPELKPPAEPED